MSRRAIHRYFHHQMPVPFKRAMSTPDSIHHGFELAAIAEVGDDMPHPQDNDEFFHAMRAGLRRRGLDLSMFLRVIEAGPR